MNNQRFHSRNVTVLLAGLLERFNVDALYYRSKLLQNSEFLNKPGPKDFHGEMVDLRLLSSLLEKLCKRYKDFQHSDFVCVFVCRY